MKSTWPGKSQTWKSMNELISVSVVDMGKGGKGAILHGIFLDSGCGFEEKRFAWWHLVEDYT